MVKESEVLSIIFRQKEKAKREGPRTKTFLIATLPSMPCSIHPGVEDLHNGELTRKNQHSFFPLARTVFSNLVHCFFFELKYS